MLNRIKSGRKSICFFVGRVSITPWLGLILAINLISPALAHEVRPAYLEIRESAPDIHDILWKQPISGYGRLALDPVFPEDCQITKTPAIQLAGGARLKSWQIACKLDQSRLQITGLERTLTDVYVRQYRLSEKPRGWVVKPGLPFIDFAQTPDAPSLAYIGIGVEHILFGYDHLFFVLLLVLIVPWRKWGWMITSFTLAHSLTLGMSALAGVSLPQGPVEILIALSIVFLAVEAVKAQRGHTGGVSATKPWFMAFGFGLLHGFGFAGALSEIGLPDGEEVIALFFFNIGVELGQLCIILLLAFIGFIMMRISTKLMEGTRWLIVYVIGPLAGFWVIERLMSVFAF